LIPVILLSGAWSVKPVQAGDLPRYDRVCISNVKQLVLGAVMYSSDYDDTLPDARHWMTRTKPYLAGLPVQTCPEVKDPGSFGYAMNLGLSERREQQVSDVGTTPLVYDSTNLSWNGSDYVSSLPVPGRHKGRDTIGYVDGHAQGVRPESQK
jgi:hypothetical protein